MVEQALHHKHPGGTVPVPPGGIVMLAAPALIDRLMTNYWAEVSWYGNYDAASGTIP